MARILLIDDDPDFSEFLRGALTASDHAIECLDSAQGGPELLARAEYDVVLLDNRMPGTSGIEFLAALTERGIRVPVILMTGDPTSDTAIQAMNLGAFDYVVKPLDIDQFVEELEPLVSDAEEFVRSMKEHVRLPDDSRESVGDGPQLLGSSRAMQEVYKRIGMVAGSSAPVLIVGETGTGKELIARAIHSYSPRRNQPLVAVNCAALSESLLESELFGYEKGAFTGAEKLRKGRFEYASGGTLFLDELGDMPAALQAKLLRVLQDGEIARIGGNEPIRVDVRLVSATNRDLTTGVRDGDFRLDLLKRLDVFPICVPPLRERGEDVLLLAEHFLERAARSLGKPVPALDASARKRLCESSWPGNLRELQNVMRRVALTCRRLHVAAADLDFGLSETPAGPESPSDVPALLGAAVRAALASGKHDLYKLLVEGLEQELLAQSLAAHERNKLHTARRLGVSRGWLLKKLRELGIE
ncbi:MAG TPA: sigma-54 dependent transcriptional regulator [Planctomycetaceae bacterium]|nr:sigma-54 dependent transcriptional regulator [Planctomycetaceae bacterium]